MVTVFFQKKVEENTEEKEEPTPRKPEPKKLNPFQKVANESAKSGGFGGLSITKSASGKSFSIFSFKILACLIAKGFKKYFRFNRTEPFSTTRAKEHIRRRHERLVWIRAKERRKR